MRRRQVDKENERRKRRGQARGGCHSGRKVTPTCSSRGSVLITATGGSLVAFGHCGGASLPS